MRNTRHSAFLRPGKLVLVLLLALLVYAVALLMWLPAGWLWTQARFQLMLPPQLEVQQVTGTLWAGAAGVRFAGHPVQLTWQMGWPSAVQVPVDIRARSAQSILTGQVRVGWPLSVALQARGQIHVADFEPLIRQSGGALLAGDVTIDRLHLQWADHRLQQAQGSARWPGGAVSWPMGDRRQTAEFPPMAMTLQQNARGLALQVLQQGRQAPAADATILANGTLDLQVYKRLIDLAGQPWSGAANPDDVVFRVRQPLLPGGLW
ncbi:type II secretion system protein N [Marinobacter sp. X15-166B]|uniref:type II secretion system protein N n=1 Tax=Marinobacter sp. X15-166B TaxID=1897620 RepID=UPI00085C2BE5|nr:type II secretion system protein N [Marinobacter sp. X15-166B]OEY65121.1 hypothetical protein BG841_00660 [Marinobacter sp. X15-166B]